MSDSQLKGDPASDMESAEPRAADDPANLGRRLDGLIGMLSHDLRTPLSAISGWLFLLESGKLDPSAQKRALSKIRASVDEQVKLIDETLLISRGQIGRLALDSAPASLRDALEGAINALREPAAAKNVAIEPPASLTDMTLDASAELLQRAFDLLLAHALKATPSGGRISVSTIGMKDRVRITISDTGAGFSHADLPYVLDPFQAPADGQKRMARGAERGLLLAHALIQAHRGRLRIASPGIAQGETFTIELPASRFGAASAES